MFFISITKNDYTMLNLKKKNNKRFTRTDLEKLLFKVGYRILNLKKIRLQIGILIIKLLLLIL